jgi:hypothetical protein
MANLNGVRKPPMWSAQAMLAPSSRLERHPTKQKATAWLAHSKERARDARELETLAPPASPCVLAQHHVHGDGWHPAQGAHLSRLTASAIAARRTLPGGRGVCMEEASLGSLLQPLSLRCPIPSGGRNIEDHDTTLPFADFPRSEPVGWHTRQKGLVPILGYLSDLRKELLRASQLCSSQSGQAWSCFRGHAISLLLRQLVR